MAATATKYWWEAKENVHKLIHGVVKAMENDQAYRKVDDLRNYRLYANQDVEGFGLRAYTRSRKPLEPERLSFNVVESCCDTFANKMSKNRPRPYHVTDGADWSQMRRAKKLNKFTLGLFQQTRFYELLGEMIWDTGPWGTGCLHIFNDGKKVRAERVLPGEILVDEAEAIYGKPEQLHRIKYYTRAKLLKQAFVDTAEKKAAVKRAGKADTALSFRETHADMVKVVESWHLPSAPGAKDGRHVISIDELTLLEEDYKRERFPFIFIRFKAKRIGFWGGGIAEELSGIQKELNRLAVKIQRMMGVHVSRILMRRQAKIPKAHIDNDVGAILEVDDPTDVHVSSDNSVPSEFFMERERLWNRGFEKVGITQLSSSGKKPAGVDAAVALRELNDIESDRFYSFGLRLEQAVVDAAELMLEEVEALHEEGIEDYEVRCEDRRSVDRIKWDDVREDREQFVLKVFPVSSLPSTPAFRQQTVSEWVDRGWIDAVEGRRLLDFPDLDSSNNMATAAWDYIDSLIEDIFEKGEDGYQAPDEYEDLQLGLKRMTYAYLIAKRQKCPEEVLDLFREWIDEAKALIKASMPAPAPAVPAVPPMAPPGMAPPMAA